MTGRQSTSRWRAASTLTCAVLVTATVGAWAAPRGAAPALAATARRASIEPPLYAHAAAVRADYSRLPLAFEAAPGRGADGVRYVARGNGYTVYLTPRDAVLWLGAGAHQVASRGAGRTALLRFRLLGADTGAPIAGVERQGGVANYFNGADRRAWRTGLATYAQVVYSRVYPGVALSYYGSQGRLEYDFRLAPLADPNVIRQRIDGVSGLRLTPSGDLLLAALGGGTVRWARPVAYQVGLGGRRIAVSALYRLLGARTIGFTLGRYNRALPLVIDPVLSYSTFFGYGDIASGIALDPSGAVYVTGYTVATIITDTHMLQLNRVPTTCPAASQNPCADAFVAKLSAGTHRLVYSTYLGGSGNDVANGIAVDAHGSAYIAGGTTSADFPVTANAFQKTNHGGSDAFIVKLSPDGRALEYSTYLGGSIDNANTAGDDAASAIAVDAHGSAYVTGYTYSYNFPLKNPMQGSLGYGRGTLGTQVDAFVTKLNAAGSGLVYSTYLGGSLSDSASGIAVDAGGNAYVTGQTNSPDFPTPPHALQAQLYGTDYNSFVAKLNKWGSALFYSTYLGRSAADKTHGIAVDSAGNAYVVGETNGGMPRTIGVAQPTSGGGVDAFVAKLSTRGVLTYSTYLGGAGNDIGYAIALDPAGDAYVTGSTDSAAFSTPVFPLKGAIQTVLGGSRGGFGNIDAFVAKVNSCGNQLLYSSYLGGTFVDSGQAIAVDFHGNAYIAGQTLSPNFPIAGALAGGATYVPPAGNAFIAKVSGSPASPAGACPLPLTLDVPPAVSSSTVLTVTVHTAPRADVSATLVVTNAVPPPAVQPTPVSSTAPKPPAPPKLGALLYRASVHGTADAYGLYVGYVRLKYPVMAALPATVKVLVRRGHAAVTVSVPVQLTP